MLRFFIYDWIMDYITTPKYEMTKDIELLGLFAIGIIAFSVLGFIFGVWLIIDFIKGKVNRK